MDSNCNRMLTNWVETTSVRQATGAIVTNLIRDNIIYRFGIPKPLLSKSDTPFINVDVWELLNVHRIDHVKHILKEWSSRLHQQEYF